MAYGSARLARRADIEAARLFKKKGYRLGVFEDEAGADLLHYAGQRHLLTCAPTRAGKEVSWSRDFRQLVKVYSSARGVRKDEQATHCKLAQAVAEFSGMEFNVGMAETSTAREACHAS